MFNIQWIYMVDIDIFDEIPVILKFNYFYTAMFHILSKYIF